MISLAQIQAFLEVARSGSFASAGQRLSIPRSTVSARVRALEEKLNIRLLLRTTRRVALTEEGRRYMERCEEAIDQLEQAEAELAHSHDLSGTIRITLPVDMPKRRLAEILGAFVDRHPSIHIEVIVTDEVLDKSIPALPLHLVMPSRQHLPARIRAFIDYLTAPEMWSSVL